MSRELKEFYKLAAATGVPDIVAAVERIQVREAQIKKRAKLSGFKRLIKRIHRLARVDGAFQVAMENGVVVRWVWGGSEFSDKIARSFLDGCDASVAVEANQLKELRLVNTSLGNLVIEELARALPDTKITVFSEADEIANWRVSQAYYCGESPAEWDANAAARLSKIRRDEF